MLPEKLRVKQGEFSHLAACYPIAHEGEVSPVENERGNPHVMARAEFFQNHFHQVDKIVATAHDGVQRFPRAWEDLQNLPGLAERGETSVHLPDAQRARYRVP